jgi:hypothetical protein
VGGIHTKTEKRLPVRLYGQLPTSHSSNTTSLDTEGLFDLEGMDDVPTESLHSEEETDTDGNFQVTNKLFSERTVLWDVILCRANGRLLA